MSDDAFRELLASLERRHQQFRERVRQRELLEALRSTATRQQELLDLARGGAREEARLRAHAKKPGGRRRKADPAALRAAFRRYVAEHPHHTITAAQEAVAQEFGVGPRTVFEARKGE